MSKDNRKKACSVFDGTSYFGVFAFDLKDLQDEDPDIEVVEEHSYWLDEMDKRIENLNNGL